MRKPNLLLITSDQHRRSAVGCYGNRDVITPNMDRMAREGVRFDQCMTVSPLCSPFRASLQTGLYPHQNGCRENAIKDLGRFKGMGDYLTEAGYNTCFVGKTHWHKADDDPMEGFVPVEHRMGWNEWYGTPKQITYNSRLYNDDGTVRKEFPGQYEPTLQTDWALDFMGRQTAGKPWCLCLNYGSPHSVHGIDEYHDRPAIWRKLREVNAKYGLGLSEHALRDDSKGIPQIMCPQHLMFDVVPREFLDMYDKDALTLDEDVPEGWETLARYYYKEYYAMVTALDREIGRVMAYLEASGRIDNTIVLYTSDHGELLCTHGAQRGKSQPLRNALSTPLLAWGPAAGVGKGRIVDALVNTVDLLPTVLDLAGENPAAELPGQSVASWILSNHGPRQEAIFMELYNWRAVYDGRYIYVLHEYKKEPFIRPARLTDLEKDPLEQSNFIDAPEYADVRERLHETLMGFVERRGNNQDEARIERQR